MNNIIDHNISEWTHPQTATARTLLPTRITVQAVACLIASVLLLIPCFWLPRISAGDLASHIYNAWIVQLIRQGRVQGIWVANQSTNVLFDVALDVLSQKFGFAAAQKIAVSVAVLLFFWSAFALISEMAGRVRWFVVPYLAILAYGSVFNMGLFNYYLGGGFALLAMSLLWRPNVWRVGAATLFLFIGWLAQPLPVLWALGLLAYRTVARKLPSHFQPWMWIISLGTLLLVRHWKLANAEGLWSPQQFLHSTGVDQSYMFGQIFRITTGFALILCATALVDTLRNQGWRRLRTNIPFQFYMLSVAAAVLLPYSIAFSWYQAWFGAIPERIGWLAAVPLCAVLARARASTRLGVAFTVLSVLYFSFLYATAREMNQMEQKVQAIVNRLPAQSAVVADLRYPPVEGFDISMILDRTCIQHCFSFGNYEPSTMQFRVRAVPGNPVVAWSQADTAVHQFFSAFPDRILYQIHSCGSRQMDVCIRALHRSDDDQPQGDDKSTVSSVPSF